MEGRGRVAAFAVCGHLKQSTARSTVTVAGRSVSSVGSRRKCVRQRRRTMVAATASPSDDGLPRMNLVSVEDVVERKTIASALQSLVLFFVFFCLCSLVVRRVIFFNLPVHEQIVACALTIILPDLARLAFVALGELNMAGRSTRRINGIGYGAKTIGYAATVVINALKVAGYFVAGVGRPSKGALLVMLAQILFNSCIHFGVISRTPYQMRTRNRTVVIVMDSMALLMAYCTCLSIATMATATLFFTVVVAYWLSKYDIDVIFPL